MVHDYIRYRLTGEFTIEETNISGSNLYNQYSGDFDAQLMKIFAIEEVADKTAPIIGSADLAGYVSEQAAAACGLKAGLPVFGGMFDVVGAALTSGLHDSHQLSAVAALGQSPRAYSMRSKPLTTPMYGGNIASPTAILSTKVAPPLPAIWLGL